MHITARAPPRSSASCCWSRARSACADSLPGRRALLARSFRCLLSHDGAHARDVAAHFFQLARISELLRGDLHAQPELRAQQRFEFLLQLLRLLAAQFARFHPQPPSMRCTTIVRNGSFAAASAKASLAMACVMPSISKMILP